MPVLKMWSADCKVRKMVVAENYEDLMEKGYFSTMQAMITGCNL